MNRRGFFKCMAGALAGAVAAPALIKEAIEKKPVYKVTGMKIDQIFYYTISDPSGDLPTHKHTFDAVSPHSHSPGSLRVGIWQKTGT